METERKLGLTVVLASAIGLFALIPYGVDTPNKVDHIVLSPDFWPKIIVAIIGLMGVLMSIRPSSLETQKEGERKGSGIKAYRLLITLAVLFAFYFVVPSLGLVLPAILLIAGMMWFAGERRLQFIVPIAVATPLLLFFFFERVASIPIPLGLLESLRG